MNKDQIQSEFITLLRQTGEKNGFRCQFWSQGTRRMGTHIIELSGSITCLIYFHVRSEEPYSWGVTANRIAELKQSGRKWVLALLYESTNKGYLITAEDVNRYSSIWSFHQGDYKVGPGRRLRFNKPFHSFSEFINSLLTTCR